jgi:dipeptidyl aminopeptidase/acylaminoacyl peptidase
MKIGRRVGYMMGVAAALLLAAGALLVYGLWLRADAPAVTTQPTAELPARQSNPLFIDDIAAYKAQSGQITVEQELGSPGGYPRRLISYRSDGLKIYALQTLPAGTAPAGGWPVVILAHGYIVPSQYQTTGGDYATWIATLNQAGYAVIKPDYRGHGRSEGTAEGGHFSPVYTYDVLNLIASLKNWPTVNAGRLGVIGHSLGAHVALRTAVVSSDVKATVYVSGVVGSMEDIFFNWPRPPYVNDQPIQAVQGRRQQLIAEHGDPHSDPDFWKQASAISYVDRVKGVSQIHHGTADDQVPLLFSQHLTTALQGAGKPVESYEYTGGGHQFERSDYRQQMLQRIIGLLRSALAG